MAAMSVAPRMHAALRPLALLIVLIGLLAPAPPAIAAAAAAVKTSGTHLYRLAPAPQWVLPRAAEYDAPIPADDIDNGSFYVLFDRQVRVLAGGDEAYTHIAVKVATPAGVDGNSQVDMTLDPDWQRLALHFVRIVRDGKAIDQLGRARISEFAQESEREEQIYNGNWTVNLLLSDLRVGDVVEYAYTTYSRPALFADHYWDHVATTWTDPVRYQRLRILYPATRALRYRRYGETQAPHAATLGAERELAWEWHDVPAVRAESDTPAWHEPWSAIEFTDLPDWGAVVKLAAPLYDLPDAAMQKLTAPLPAPQLTPRLAAAIESVRASARTPAERLLQTLRFVQDDIRYTGIEIGEGSHRPRPPELVLETRFGDCKDKTLLMVTMLRALGIEAVPVLVHSDQGAALDERLPTPYAFNHVIARARLAGRDYWLDGTNSNQKGALGALAQPSFGWGLPLQQGAQALVAMPRQANNASGWSVATTLDLRGGADAPARLSIASSYRGDSADAMRRDLDAMSRSEREAKYLNYYAALYPGIRRLRNYDIHDDVATNTLRISEDYVVDGVFARSREGRALTLSADEIEPYTHLPETRLRRTPLAIAYPLQLAQEFTVLLPPGWSADTSSMRIDNPAFRYSSSARLEQRTLHLRYDYVALHDHVDVVAIPQFFRDVTQMKNDLGYRLGVGESGVGARRLPQVAIAALGFLAGLGVAWLVRRRRSSAIRI